MADQININNDDNIKVNNEDKFTISDVKDANAGFSFGNSNWVKAWENIDNENYENVRGSDKILGVLKSHKNMQFTHTQEQQDERVLNKYLRLLMPKYIRRVEVEDLNRNFWVLGQAISAIAAYLFEKRLVTDVHTEVIYLNGINQYYDYYEMKYDNFDNSGNEAPYTFLTTSTEINSIISKLEHFKKTYENTILVIVPVIRQDNYKDVYYSKEYYPGIAIYNPNNLNDTEGYFGWHFIKFVQNNTIDIEDTIISDNLLAVNTEDEKIIYYGSYKKIKNGTQPECLERPESWYKGILRTLPVFGYEIDNNGNIKIRDFNIFLEDVGCVAAGVNLSTHIFGRIHYDSYITENMTSVNLSSNITEREFTNTKIWYREQVKGFYLGEVLSTKSIKSSLEPIDPTVYNLSVQKTWLRPIKESYYSDRSNYNARKNENNYIDVLNAVMNNKGAKKVSLFIGEVKGDWYYDEPVGGDLGDHYYLNGTTLKYGVEDFEKYQNTNNYYNGYKETSTVVAGVYFPEELQQQNYVADESIVTGIMPTLTIKSAEYDSASNRHYRGQLEAAPEIWDGGRIGSSIMTLEDLKDSRTGQYRQTEKQYYYEIYTEDGDGITEDTNNWMIAYTEVTFQYGLLPKYYSTRNKNGYYLEVTFTSNPGGNDTGHFNTTVNNNENCGIFNDQNLVTYDNTTAISSEGWRNSTSKPANWSSTLSSNKSNYISKTIKGLPFNVDVLQKVIELLNSSGMTGNKVTINFCVDYVAGSTGGTGYNQIEIDVNNKCVNVHYPNNAGPSNYSSTQIILDMNRVTKDYLKNIKIQNKKIINPESVKTEYNEGFYEYFGSVVDVNRIIFNKDGTSTSWHTSRYNDGNNSLVLQQLQPANKTSAQIAQEKSLKLYKIGGNLLTDNPFNGAKSTTMDKVWDSMKNSVPVDSRLNVYIQSQKTTSGASKILNYQKYPYNGVNN